MTDVYKQLKSFGKVKLAELMSKHTTFKIGGPAEYFLQLTDVAKLPELLSFLDGEGIEYMILGGGSNMLVHDEGFRGVVIEIQDKGYKIDGNLVEAAAGMITVQLAQATVKEGLTGFEWGVGVPGTIGGAVRGNAGAMGVEMKDNIKEVEAYIDGDVVRLSNDDCAFGYRSSRFKTDGGIVLRAWLELEKGDAKAGMKEALSVLKYRNETQPKGFASTGCIFKNADWNEHQEALLKHFNAYDEKVKRFSEVGKISAGWLVQEAGLKGKQIGDAQISDVHGNFIVNLGKAEAKDVLSLVEEIKAAVYNRFGIQLEEEIQII